MTTSPEQSLVSRTIDVWDTSSSPPSVASLVALLAEAPLRQQADAMLVDQRMRWERDIGVFAEDYFTACPDLASDPEIRCDLVYGELRARGGGTQILSELTDRFPDLQQELARQMSVSHWLDVASEESVSPHDTASEGFATVANEPFDPAPLLLSDFEVLDELGAGAMGSVFRATQKSLQKTVALKMLKPSLSLEPDFVERFLREARSTASLQHPGIVDVHGVGRSANGGYFLVMDLVQGRTLRELYSVDLPGFAQAARVVDAVADAIDHAHQRGIIHRDLKPGNVMITDEGAVMVLDFGLARQMQSGDIHLTADGATVGTPAWMAPEQVASDRGDVTPACDIYAIGGLLYFLLTGRSPSQANSVGQTIANVLAEELVAKPSELREGIPTGLESLCLDCLRKDPAQRPQTATEVRQRLSDWLCETQRNDRTTATTPPVRSRRVLLGGIPVLLAVAGAMLLTDPFQWLSDRSALPGSLEPVRVTWSAKVYSPGESPQARPLTGSVVNSERIRITASLEAPRYAYAWWIGSDGTVTRLQEQGPPARPVTEVRLPSSEGFGFPIEGERGTEICVLLLCDKRLEDPHRLTDALRPPQPFPELVFGRPVADGLPMIIMDSDDEELLAALKHAERGIGPAEPLTAGPAGTEITVWRQTLPDDAGEFHYLAIPHGAP